MLSRRDLLMGVPVAARLGRPQQQRASSPPPGNPGNGPTSGDLMEIRNAIRDLHHLTPSADVDLINEKRRTHFKVNQKFPNYIDIGLTIWERLYAWHLDNHLPLSTRRTPDGRMEMDFMYTTLILKWEMGDAIIGVPYD